MPKTKKQKKARTKKSLKDKTNYKKMSPEEIRASKEKLGIQETKKETETVQRKKSIWTRIKEFFGLETELQETVTRREPGGEKPRRVFSEKPKEQYQSEYCSYCGRKYTSWADAFLCKHCGRYYCSDCRVPETHHCPYRPTTKPPPGGFISYH